MERVFSTCGCCAIDGGFATAMESHGHDLSSSLWSARMLCDQPAAITAAHADFFGAGASVAITASYQASRQAFERAMPGTSAAEADALLSSSVSLAHAAKSTRRRSTAVSGAGEETGAGEGSQAQLVAASVGPYGAYMAGGQEYTGDYGAGIGAAQVEDFHRPRVAALLAAAPPPDLLAYETIPNMLEVDVYP